MIVVYNQILMPEIADVAAASSEGVQLLILLGSKSSVLEVHLSGVLLNLLRVLFTPPALIRIDLLFVGFLPPLRCLTSLVFVSGVVLRRGGTGTQKAPLLVPVHLTFILSELGKLLLFLTAAASLHAATVSYIYARVS